MSQCKDIKALHILLETDWIRIVAWFVYIAIVCWMMIRILKTNETVAKGHLVAARAA